MPSRATSVGLVVTPSMTSSHASLICSTLAVSIKTAWFPLSPPARCRTGDFFLDHLFQRFGPVPTACAGRFRRVFGENRTMAATKAWRRLVSMLTLHIPRDMARFMASSGTPEAPCSTRGTSTVRNGLEAVEIQVRPYKHRGQCQWLRPGHRRRCGRQTPALFRNSHRRFPVAGDIVPVPPMRPSSASTDTPTALATLTASVAAMFSSSGSLEPSYITELNCPDTLNCLLKAGTVVQVRGRHLDLSAAALTMATI